MVNVLKMIRQRKEQFRQRQIKKGQLENIAKAEELKKLREERIRLEGKATLEQARQEEISKIEKAKQQNPSKLKMFVNRIKKETKEFKKNKKPFELGGSFNFGGGKNKNPFSSGGRKGPFN